MVNRFARRWTDPLAPYATKGGVLAAIYVVVARLSLLLDPVGHFASWVWPPTGLALAVLLLFGPRLWPGIAVGAAVANVWQGAPLPVACGIALGNTLEAVLGAYALRRIPGFRPSFDRLPDVLALVVLGALASTLVSATIGVASLYFGGMVPAARFAETWRAWWLGDALGDLVVAPFVLHWTTTAWLRVERRRWIEALALGAALLAASVVLFSGGETGAPGLTALRQPTTLLPLFIWAALRFGTRGVTGATLLASIVAVWSTTLGHGPFVRAELQLSLALVQGFMGVVAVTFLVLAAVTAERARAQDHLVFSQRERPTPEHVTRITPPSPPAPPPLSSHRGA